MKKINKRALRQSALKELVESHAVADQQTLVSMMKDRYNIITNQSILSRDLRTLGINKRTVQSRIQYEAPAVDASQEILRRAVIEVVHNESTIVIKTLPGLASVVADYIDAQADNDILGTLAGENCIFVAPHSIKMIHKTANKIKKILTIKND